MTTDSTTDPHALVRPTERGLWCEPGGFHIDPWRPVEHAVVTHAHADHASPGSTRYLASTTGAVILRERIGPAATIDALPWGERRSIGDVTLSLHPAGHILGSAQVRIEHAGEVWVVSGDYKTSHDPTCEAFESVPCHTFITESTFGLPIYRWPGQDAVLADLHAWWRDNQRAARTSIVFVYALGKAQRILAGLDPTLGPIAVHGAVARMNDAYCRAGVPLPDVPTASGVAVEHVRGHGLVIAPPSALGTPWMRKFATGKRSGGDSVTGLSSALASGWMAVRGTRRRRPVDRGFVLSDHADWPGLLAAIRATGAQRIGVTHGSTGPMIRHLRESLAIDAFDLPTRFRGEARDDADEPATPDHADPPEAGA